MERTNMSNYTDTIQHARNLLSATLRDENQGNITFSGSDHLLDLDINHPCDLSQLRAGTVLAVNGEEWMLIENCDAARKWNTYWMSCDGVAMNCDDFYVHAIQHSDSLVYCHEAI